MTIEPNRYSYLSIIVLSMAVLSYLLMVPGLNAAEPSIDPSIQKVILNLEAAIKGRDFSRFDTRKPEEKPLSWGLCDFSGGTDFTMDGIVEKLRETSRNAIIQVNENTVEILSIYHIETKGWPGENPYLYFHFQPTRHGWRWLGVSECESRDSEFRFSQGEDRLDADFTTGRGGSSSQDEDGKMVEKIKEAVRTKSFEALRSQVPVQAIYYWNDCGPGDVPNDELYFDEIQTFLQRESKGVPIYINPKPEMDWDEKGFSIETEGWNGEYPYFVLQFSRAEPGKWKFTGGCSYRRPILNQPNGGYSDSVVYFRTPDLPRPGARVFYDASAFHARIQEIVRYKAFAALKPYAIRGKLTEVTCDAYMTNSNPRGNEIEIDEAIRRLKNNATASIEIKLRGAYGANRYLVSTGWTIDPYIYFGFSETTDGWEWTKIAFCKDDLFMRPPSENTGPHKPLMQHRMIQAAIAAGVIALITGLVLAYRHEKERLSSLAVAGGREAAIPATGVGVKKHLSGAIGIILMLVLVLVSVWSFNQALTLEETAGALPDEIGRYYLIQKLSLAGIVAILAGLFMLNRKEKINRPAPRPKQIPVPSERIQNFLGPMGSNRRRYLLTMVPGLGQAAAGRKTRGFLSVLAFPLLWCVLYLIYIDIESQFFSFPMYPVIPTLISTVIAMTGALWVWFAVDAIRLNEITPWRSSEYLPSFNKLFFPLIPVAAGITSDLLLGNFDNRNSPLMFGWAGAGAGLLGLVAWRLQLGGKKIALAAVVGFIIGLFTRYVSFTLPMPIGGFIIYRPLVGGFMIGFFVFVVFMKTKISPLVIPATTAWAWIGSIVIRFLRIEVSDTAAPWIASIVYHGPTLFEFYWIGLAILWLIDNLKQTESKDTPE